MNLGKIAEALSDQPFPFRLRIDCEGHEILPIDMLEDFQGELKTRSETDVVKILRSIRDYGFSFPFFYVYLDDHRYVLDGHGRLMALLIFRQLGGDIPKLPACRVDAKDTADAKQKLLRLNSQYGTIDLEELKDFVDGLEVDIGDLKLPDISIDDLEDIFSGEEKVETEADDEIPETVPEISKLGDLWELNDHRILCGDSTDIESMRRLIENRPPAVYIVDPPYEQPDLYDVLPGATENTKCVLFWDYRRFGIAPFKAITKGWNPLYEFIWNTVTSEYYINRPLARHRAAGVFGADIRFDTASAIIHDGKIRKSQVVVNRRGRLNYRPLDGAVHIRTVEDFPKTAPDNRISHSKPIAWLTAIFNGIGGTLYLDYFLGSGSTLIACEKTSRICYSMEIEPHYVDVSVRRWVDWCRQNGKTPIIKRNGKRFAINRFTVTSATQSLETPAVHSHSRKGSPYKKSRSRKRGLE